MNEVERTQRDAVVREARSWVAARTPYHHHARVKGAGVDCGQLLVAVYCDTGVVPLFDPGDYPHDWHMHHSEERYLQFVASHAHRIEGPPLPGDIVVYKFGRCVSHGAIVVEWPRIIHSYFGLGVIEDDSVANADLAERRAGFYSVWGSADE